jgi:hypothetical protein
MPVEESLRPVAPNPPEAISRRNFISRALGRSSSPIILPSDSLYAQKESAGTATQRLLNTQLDRRGFLIGTGAAGVGATALLEAPLITEHILGAVDKKGEQLFNLCNVSPDVFFSTYGEKLKRIRPATTFIPEDHDRENGSHNSEAAFEELRTIVEDLGIKKIRIGIRWENAIGKDGMLDLNFYEPFLQYCFDNKVKICLNIGLKTCGYPEIFVPNRFLVKPGNPPDGGVIKLDSPIVPITFDYSHQLLSYLSSYFSEDELALIETVQPENEPFVNYGNKRWTMDPEYLKEFAKLCSSYLPKARILVNDNLWNLLHRDKAPNLVAEMTQGGDNRWEYGVNYYFAVPQIAEFISMIPFLSNKDKRMIGRFDPLILGMVPPLSYIPLFSFDRIRDVAKQKGFPIHVSEGQAEPFTGVLLRDGKQPGESLTGYQYLFYMITEHIANFDQQQIIEVSTWKASQLARRMRKGELTNDDRGMIDVTQRLAGQAA